jgi:hypothetical protein
MPSDYRQCKLCDKIFRYAGSPFCPACVKEVDKRFRLVKDFLYKNPNLTITEVAEQTETDERIILHFLKEGRLEMSSAGDFLKCEACGASITSGRLCSKCAGGLSKALESALQRRGTQAQKNPDLSVNNRMLTATYKEKNKRR